MSLENNYTVALETIEKGKEQYRIIKNMDFGDLFFSYINNDIHSDPVPTRLIEFFEDFDNITDKMPINISVILSNSSWKQINSEAKVYASKEIDCILKHQDKNEIKDVIPMLGRIAYGDAWNTVVSVDDLISEDEFNTYTNEVKTNDSRKPYCINIEKEFTSVKEAGRELGIRPDHISEACRGKRKSAGKDDNGNKLKWKYV